LIHLKVFFQFSTKEAKNKVKSDLEPERTEEKEKIAPDFEPGSDEKYPGATFI
jgi:hypothetical protein